MSVGAGFYKLKIWLQTLLPAQPSLHDRTKEWVENIFYKEMMVSLPFYSLQGFEPANIKHIKFNLLMFSSEFFYFHAACDIINLC